MSSAVDCSTNDWGTPGCGGLYPASLYCSGVEREQGQLMADGTGSQLRTFALADLLPSGEPSSAVCPARPCFLLTHIPTRLPSVPVLSLPAIS